MKSIPGNDLTRRVIGCAIEVHRHLGPGLVENMYEAALCDELAEAGLSFARQRRLPVHYKGRILEGHYQLDVIVEETLVLEIKAVHQVHPIHQAQLMTYLRLSEIPGGAAAEFQHGPDEGRHHPCAQSKRSLATAALPVLRAVTTEIWILTYNTGNRMEMREHGHQMEFDARPRIGKECGTG